MSEENEKEGCGCGCGCDAEHKDADGCGCGHDCQCGEGEGNCECNHAHDEGGRCCGHNHGAAPSDEDIDYSQFDVDLPKPTLIMIVTTIAQQAMVSMGILPNPATGKSVFLMKQASYLIDSIDVLFEKTKGNRTDEETRTISSVMSELRMLYVKASEEKSRRDAAKKS